MKKENSKVFWERGSLYHRTKKLSETGKVIYGKLGGFKTEEEAEISYDKHLAEFKEQQRKFYGDKIDREMMFKDYLIYWFEELYAQRIENTTYFITSYIIYDLIIPSIDYDIKLRLTTTDYLDSITARCFIITPSGGEASRSIIYRAFKDSILFGFLASNPALNMKIYPRPKPKITILNKNQIKKLLSAARSTPWYLEILLALFVGLRKGEILGLKENDFDIENRAVTISHQLVMKKTLKRNSSKTEKAEYDIRPPKTDNSIRRLRVPNVIMEELKTRVNIILDNKKKLGDKYIDNGYISCQENGLPHSMAALNLCLNNLCDRNGLPRISVHGLRHMFATILIEHNVSLVKIKGLLGHSSIHTTFEYYCDVMDEKEKILSFMNNVFVATEEGASK